MAEKTYDYGLGRRKSATARARLTKGKGALIAQNGELAWATPWDWETVWQVFIVGFFLMGQILVPLVFALIPKPEITNARLQALSTLATYLLLAAGAVSIAFSLVWRAPNILMNMVLSKADLTGEL